VTALSPIDKTLTAQVRTGPLAGLQGSILDTTPNGKTYLRLNDIPGVTLLVPSHFLKVPGTDGRQPS